MLNEDQFEKGMICNQGKSLLKCLSEIHVEKTSSLIKFSKKWELEVGEEFSSNQLASGAQKCHWELRTRENWLHWTGRLIGYRVELPQHSVIPLWA